MGLDKLISEDEATEFFELIPGMVQSDHQKLISGEPENVSIPQFKTQRSGRIEINHGFHGDHYVWHISPATELTDTKTNKARKVTIRFKISEQQLLWTFASILSSLIPNTCKVDMWPPNADWEVQAYTVKAYDVKPEWSFTQSRIDEHNVKLFTKLNEFV